MKKRLLSVLLTASVTLSTTACGETGTPAGTTGADTADVTTTTEKNDTAEATTTTAAVTEEITTTTEALKEVQKITDKPDIYDECMVFERVLMNFLKSRFSKS